MNTYRLILYFVAIDACIDDYYLCKVNPVTINSSCMVVIIFILFWMRLWVLKPLSLKYYLQCLIVLECSTGTWWTVRQYQNCHLLARITYRTMMTSIRTLFQRWTFEIRWSCDSENSTFCLNSVWPAQYNLRQLLRQIMGRWRFIRLSTLHLLYTRTKEEIPDLQRASFLVNNCWRDTRLHKLLLLAGKYPREDKLYFRK